MLTHSIHLFSANWQSLSRSLSLMYFVCTFCIVYDAKMQVQLFTRNEFNSFCVFFNTTNNGMAGAEHETEVSVQSFERCVCMMLSCTVHRSRRWRRSGVVVGRILLLHRLQFEQQP